MADPYISEIRYHASTFNDFVEVVVDAGTDISDLTLTVYNADGTIRSENGLDDLTPTTMNGKDIYVLDRANSSTFRGIAGSNGAALSDSTQVYSFVSFSTTSDTITATEGAADGLTSTEIGTAGANLSLETTDDGATYAVADALTPGSIPCLTRGSLIDTDKGPVKIEDLCDGDMIRTHDGGFKPLRLILRKFVASSAMAINPKLYPVRIAAGSLGDGLPRTDMHVSRQHRMVVSSPITKRMFDSALILVPAVRLTKIPGVFIDTSVDGAEYFHLLFDTHEIIFADGVPTETLLLGAEALNALPALAREEIETLFPNLVAAGGDALQTAALIPEVARQKRLVKRHVANDKPILASYA